MTIFKICGLRDVGSALVATESGASLLGFNFVEGVRRQLQPEKGAEVISQFRAACDGPMPSIVGLFANQPTKFVDSVAGQCGLDYAQLCGDEPPEFWDALSVPVIRQVKVRDDLERSESVAAVLREVESTASSGHLALLDKHIAGRLGGTGSTFDWEVAREIAKDYQVIVAGGLTPENVADAIRVSRPWGVDVSSGVETGGIKDPSRIRAFADAVKSTG